MQRPRSKIQHFIMLAIVPIACSVLLGYIFFQEKVFDRHYGVFQFVSSGTIASVFYYLLQYVRLRDAIVGGVVLFFLTLLATESSTVPYILRDFIYVGGTALSVFVYARYFQGFQNSNPLYASFLLGGIYGIVYIAASEFHFVLIRSIGSGNAGSDTITIAENTAFFGILIGFAVGTGITLNARWIAPLISANAGARDEHS